MRQRRLVRLLIAPPVEASQHIVKIRDGIPFLLNFSENALALRSSAYSSNIIEQLHVALAHIDPSALQPHQLSPALNRLYQIIDQIQNARSTRWYGERP
jgi:hypothetical protein